MQHSVAKAPFSDQDVIQPKNRKQTQNQDQDETMHGKHLISYIE